MCVFVCMRRSISRLSRSSKSEHSSTSGDPFAAAPVRGPSPRGPLTRTVSRFSADPDRAHDKKVAGLPIDPAVTAAKLSLRRLRDAVDTTASFYSKYAERKRGAASGNLPLLLPDLAEWSRHEAFCGDEESRRALHTCAAQLAAIDGLLAAEHAAIGRAAAGLRTTTTCMYVVDELTAHITHNNAVSLLLHGMMAISPGKGRELLLYIVGRSHL